MLEQQRLEYLQAMGIQLWMPRRAVENAAEPSWLADDIGPANQESSVEPIKAGHAADLLADIGLEPAPEVSSEQKANIKPEIKQVEKAPVVENQQSEGSDEASSVVDLTVPQFELYFALWPCGILWVADRPFDQNDQRFQTSVSYFLLGNAVPQANYSEFKWPYIQTSNEDQTTAVAIRALTAQWEFLGGQGARAWVALDESSLSWLSKVSSAPIYSCLCPAELYTPMAKKELWRALLTLKDVMT